MSSDKRTYQRYKIEKRPILLFSEGMEYTGTIEDVSENGMGINILEPINTKKSIKYQFCYDMGNGLKPNIKVVEGSGIIARTAENFIGCRMLLNEKLSEYVRAVMCCGAN